MRKINIAIDGPSAAGKSSISDIIASKLNYVHLDTGAMYRAIAYKAINSNIAIDDEDNLSIMLNNTNLEVDESNHIFVDGNNITDLIRTNEMSMAASAISKIGIVRTYLVEKQQEIAKKKGYILDGRDIGTVVLKDAEVKIFLTADSYERAKRRYLQNQKLNIESDLLELQKEIEKRDYDDSHRKNSPLKKADDAILIDTSNLSIDEVSNKILEIINEKIKD